MTTFLRIHLFIYGRVQGVMFRQSTLELAHQKKLSGYVRNRRDGFVEAVFEGNEKSVKEMVDWCKFGPKLASVQGIEILSNEIVQKKIYESFLIESTQ